MNIWEMTILSLSEMIMLFLFIHGMNSDLHSRIWFKVMVSVLSAVSSSIFSSYVQNANFAHIISSGIYCLFIYIYLYRNKFMDIVINIELILLAYNLMLLIEFSIIFFWQKIFGSISYNFKIGLIAQVFGILLSIVTHYILRSSPIFIYIKNKNKIFIIIEFVLFMTLFQWSNLWYSMLEIFLENVILLGVTVLIVTGIMVLIFRESLNNKEAEEKAKLYDTYLPMINHTILEIRRKQHDYHNHIQVLASMVQEDTKGNLVQMENYIQTLKKEDVWKELLRLPNPVITALFYTKYNNAKMKDVSMTFDLDNVIPPSNYAITELVEVYGIVLDNAIEATQNLEAHRWINISIISFDENHTKFGVINAYPFLSQKDINHFFDEGYTTKSVGNRGLGLSKLRNILKRHSDEIIVSYNKKLGGVEVEISHG